MFELFLPMWDARDAKQRVCGFGKKDDLYSVPSLSCKIFPPFNIKPQIIEFVNYDARIQRVRLVRWNEMKIGIDLRMEWNQRN